MRPVVLLAVMSSLLIGCGGASGPAYVRPSPPTDDYGRVLFFRADQFAGSAYAHNYYIDKVLVAQVRAGGYTTLLVKAGERVVHYGPTPDYDKLMIPVSVKAGQTYSFFEGTTITSFNVDKLRAGEGAVDTFVLIENPTDEQAKAYKYTKPVVEVFEGK